ncbi:hypothetical protein ACHQM5_012187 [Ranunculus cassubicifolius]
MSASTVAVTANQPANSPVLALGARRRNVSVSEKKTSNIEMVSSEGGGVGVSEPLSSSDGKMRGDSSALKKSLLASTTTISPRPRRKSVSKAPEKPKWQTVFSVFMKNFLLLIILLGLIQLIYKLFGSGYKDGILPPHRVSEIEGRIGEIDLLLKKTSKMVQVQFDVVDKKIENEVGGVRSELMKKVEEKGIILESELKKLEAKTDGLHKSLSELETFKFLTKEDLESFSEELKNSRGAERSDEPVSLDVIMNVARDIVFKEIEKHAADGLGRVDYALASGGAKVVSYSELLFPSGKWMQSARVDSQAQKMLQPSFGQPGECFALKGSNGFVEIKLRTEIIPDAVTLEHVSKSVAYDRSSAPRESRVIGWLRPRATATTDQSTTQAEPEKPYLLTEFTYDLEKSSAQTYNVDSSVNARPVNMIRFEFRNNHGASHTCIYRLRVHGQELEKVPLSSPATVLQA